MEQNNFDFSNIRKKYVMLKNGHLYISTGHPVLSEYYCPETRDIEYYPELEVMGIKFETDDPINLPDPFYNNGITQKEESSLDYPEDLEPDENGIVTFIEEINN